MKKLIAILAVFAIMVPALFAQDEGSWSVGGSGRIGTSLNLRPYELRDEAEVNSEQGVILAGLSPFESYHGLGDLNGSLSVNYKKGGLETGLSFNSAGRIRASLAYEGGNFGFKASSRLLELLGTYDPGNGNLINDWVVNGDNLFGWYKFMDVIYLEAAVRNDGWQDNIWKVTDNDVFGTTWTLLSDGTPSYLRLAVTPIDGLDFGFTLRNLFWNNWRNTSDAYYMGVNSLYAEAGDVQNNNVSPNYRVRLLEEILEQMTLGIKFTTGPVGVALQYGLRGRPEVLTNADANFLRNVVYLGVGFNISNTMRAELDFRGDFFKSFEQTGERRPDASFAPADFGADRGLAEPSLENVSRNALQIGGMFRFDSSPLLAELGIRYRNDIWGDDDLRYEGGSVVFRPRVRYNIGNNLQLEMVTSLGIPLSDYFLASLDQFATDVKNEHAEDEELSKGGPGNIWAPALFYTFEPTLKFNFLGTGAGNWDTGIGIKYTLGGRMWAGELLNKHVNDPATNLLRVVFQWKF